MTSLNEAYRLKFLTLERAAKRQHSFLSGVAARIEDRKLVRTKIDVIRTKSLASAERKAQREGWNTEEALSQCPDIVGGRVICNHMEDFYRFGQLFLESLPVGPSKCDRQDYFEISLPAGP